MNEAVALVLKTPELKTETKAALIKLNRLRHRNIIKLLDYDLESFPFYVITEYVHGENLVNAIHKTGARPIAQLVDWLYQLADALDYMRQKGILHTNVRPSKVFVDEELNVMISPFDFNQPEIDDRTFGRFQDVCLYGSPELLSGDGKLLPLPAMSISDQYSLGLMAYKILTGNDLFGGASTIQILESRNKFKNNERYRKEKLSVFRSKPLRQIIEKLLNEDPLKRFGNLHEVVKTLNIYTHDTVETRSDLKVRNSYRRCMANNQMLITDFYEALFLKIDGIEQAFQNRKRQVAMMQMAVDILIDLDEKKDLLKNLLTNDKHKGYSLTQFDSFLDTLLDIISKNDPEWEDVKEDWQTLKDKTIAQIKIINSPKIDAPA